MKLDVDRTPWPGMPGATRAARHMVLVLLLATPGVLVSGCSLFGDDSLTVTARSDGLRVTIKNDTGDRIYYFIVGSETATLIDWMPHLDDSQSVAAGRSRVIDHDDIMMEENETQAVFWWWRAAVRDGERVPGVIVSNIIDL